jgi:DNA-binding transcriptional MerR regulator
MTREVYDIISPFLTTIGTAQVNLNTAPVTVLRVLPGMNDEIIARILALRSRGQRIANVNEVMPQPRGTPQQQQAMQQLAQRTQQQLSARAGVLTQNLLLTMMAQATPASKPVRLRVWMQRSNRNGQPVADVAEEEWR